MLRRNLIFICAVFYFSIFAAIAHAQIPQISNGLGYLASSQNPDGTWDTSTSQVETTVATVTVLESLKLLNQTAGSSYVAGASWLQGQSPQPVDYVAERIQALNLTDGSVNVLIPMWDRLTGAWGGYNGFEKNILDTALALQALKAANYADITVINPALAFLTSSQNLDGGWGFYRGDVSNVYMTAVVSATLQQFPQMTNIATAVNNATAYLLAHQNADGGFGSSPSTVYETALAYSSLAAVSTNQAALGSAVNYLTAAQSANGSWNDDPYSTALAIKALHLSENKPSPPPPPPAGGRITGTVIDAMTMARVAGVAVVLGSNSLINTTTDSSGNFTLSDVTAGPQTVSFSLAGYASKTISTDVILNSVASLGNIVLVSSHSTGTIAGTITDATGKPLTAVAITVSGAWSGSAVTAADGSYSFTHVTPGEVTIAAAKSGFQTVTGTGAVYARTTLSFSPRLSTTASQVTTGTLVGRVIDSYWGVPISPLEGEPGVKVMLSGGISVEPDSNGYFTIQGIAPNTYQVIVGMIGVVNKAFRAVITPGATTDLGTIRLPLSLSMTLTGKVTDAITGATIPGSEVTISGSDLTGRTDFAGTYAIAEIDLREFTLRVSASGYIGKSFIVHASGWLQTMDFALTPVATKGSLTGTIVEATTEQPLAGVSLALVSDPSVSAVSSTDGTFTFAAVPKGMQQVNITLNGYATRTLTTAIVTDAVNDVGKIPLCVNQLGASIQGTVWDAVANAPFSGVAIQTSGTASLQTVTAANGAYKLDNVAPGTVTVEATAVTKQGYYPARFTGSLEPGGIIVFNPALSTLRPATVDLSVVTDKPYYLKGDTVGFSVQLQNRESTAYSTLLHVKVSDPFGANIFDSSVDLALPADGALAQDFSSVLPVNVQGGEYSITADLFDNNGRNVGTARKTFSVATSRITVTPTLPAAFAVGANVVSFDLTNTGTLPVTSGTFDITLRDPDGQGVSTVSQTFGLGLGESKTVTATVSIPALRFGVYTLSYTQSDETILGRATDITLPNSISITPLFDNNSHRVRNTAGLTVTVTNKGRFTLDSTGAGLPISVSVPDAGYSETKTLTPAPVIGNIAGSTLLYSFVIPETMTAVQHGTRITVTLPSGSAIIQTTQLAIMESSLSLSPLQTAYNAGETVRPTMANSGGVDTSVQYKLSLYDAKSALIVEKSVTETVTAGGTLALNLAIPAGAMDGSYTLVLNYTDLKALRSEIIQKPLTITGVKATLSVQTDKQTYLSTEGITASSSLTNAGTVLNGANLHLQITNAADTLNKKTWTTRYDFQQGVRKGVDTYENRDNVTLLPLSDNFEDGILNLDRWNISAPAGFSPSESGGTLQMFSPTNLSYTDTGDFLNLRRTFTGDFDVSMDYDIRTAQNGTENDTINLQVDTQYYYMRVLIQRAPWLSGTYAAAVGKNGTYRWIQSAPNAGKLRLTRVGNVYTAYYWTGTAWNNIISETARADGDSSIGVGVWNQQSPAACQVNVDNFNFTTPKYATSGTLYLKYDAGVSGLWGSLNYTGDTPDGTSLKFRTRTADTQTALTTATWSDYLTANGSPITSPEGRLIEVETTLLTTDSNITPVLHDLTVAQAHPAGEILWQTDLPKSVAQGAVDNISKAVAALGLVGKFYLEGTLTSNTHQTIATAEYPFYVEQGNIQVTLAPDKKIYRPGETVTVAGEVRNLSSIAAIGLTTRVQGSGVVTPYTETFDLPANSVHPFSFTTTAGSIGTYQLSATVTQNSAPLADIADQYEVANPGLTATLNAPDTAGNAPFTISLSLNNIGKVTATSAVHVVDDFGNIVNDEVVTLGAGETRILQYSRQITGTTTFSASISGDLNQTLTKKVTYAVLATDSSVSGKIVTDKVSYNPNEVVTLTATVTAGSMKENLSTLVTVANSQGQGMYSATLAIPNLNQGQIATNRNYWNTGSYPAGTYLVTLQILDSAGSVIGKATCSLVISSTFKPSALLKGKVSLDKQSFLTSEIVNVSYSISNTGNIDLANVPLSIRTVNLKNEVVDSMTDQTTLAIGASSTGGGSINTLNYSAKDYIVILWATIAGVEETLASSYFRIEGAPSAPALSAPANETDVETFTPVLSVSNAADPNDDKLVYEFEVYSDSGLTNLITSGTVPETSGSTAWTVVSPLAENSTYYWRARAFDGRLYGDWMKPAATFRVNTVNDRPLAPTVSGPVDGSSVAVLTPLLTVNNASDPDSVNLTYNFDLALDPAFSQIVASVKGTSAGQGATSWQVPVSLAENSWYYWRAQADDWLSEGDWSGTARFLVNTANDAPSVPAVIAPANGMVVTALATDVVVTNSMDPDSATIDYHFEIDTTSTFDSANLIRSGSVAEQQNTTLWHVAGLKDNTQYFVQAKAGDGATDSKWSPVISFFVNTVNDPPTVPALANPSNGAAVNLVNPTLSIHNASDPDRDVLTYDFELYADAAMSILVAKATGVPETPQISSWTVPVALTENQTYYWWSRAYDGSLGSVWTPAGSFMVNTANDAPGAPRLSAPADGKSLATLTPTLTVVNADDPDSATLTYDFEVYNGATLVDSFTGVPQGASGLTSVTLDKALTDNTVYSWRVRAFDGALPGSWMNTANFTTHLAQATITTQIEFDPQTLNKKSNGTWVNVKIGLPRGYRASDIDINSIRLEGMVLAELRPTCILSTDGGDTLMVKFRRSEVIALLPTGSQVPVHVTGKVGAVSFEGVDVIRVIP